ncbi:hypothetical protein ACIBEJ_20690 [Nonomuraea sp. NPDC050790]|uniref:hypothetical protein n=1 Tax=Nonomuraea sp. NPDC050790 TaxID=3364371 RepID=UPI0037893EE2
MSLNVPVEKEFGLAEKEIPTRHERVMQAVRDRSVQVLTWVTLCGVVFVGAGWIMDGAAYVPGLLLELGVSLMLLVPLALLGLMLEKRLRKTEEHIRDATARLDALSAVTRERLIEHRRQRADLYQNAQRNPTQTLLRELLQDAIAVGAVTPEGPRVRIAGTTLRLRLRMAQQDQNTLEAVVEEVGGAARKSLSWLVEESAENFAERLAEVLRTDQVYPGDQSYDPSDLLLRFVELLHTAVEARTGESEHDLGTVVEIPNTQWVVSREGLYCLDRHYHIPAARLTGFTDWPTYMAGQEWADGARFGEAFRLARSLLK